jgi:uncharacterized membrane protein
MPEPQPESENIIPAHTSEVVPDEAYITKSDRDLAKQLSISYTSSSLPCSPEQLEAYDKMVPGFAQKLMNEYFIQLHHEREMEKKAIELEEKELIQNGEVIKVQEKIFNSNLDRSILGSKLGFVIALFAIGCATFLGFRGEKEVPIAIVGSLATISVIIYGTDALNKNKQRVMESKNSDELEEEK